jgi:hypothetical protein
MNNVQTATQPAFERQYSGTVAQIRQVSTTEKKPTVKRTNYYTDNVVPMVETLALDWLQLSFKTFQNWTEPDYQIGNFNFIRKSFGSKSWETIYDVYYDGVAWGGFKCNPRKTNRILLNNECHLKLDNAVLYTDFRDQIHEFERAIGGEFKHVSRIDIAADGKNLLHPLKLALQEKIHRVAAGGSEIYNKARVTKRGLECSYFRIGSNMSKRYIRAYDKVKEIKASGKQYIQNWWKLNKVQDITKMERLEIVLKSEICKQIFEIDYKCTNLAQVLNWIMDSQFKAEVLNKYIKGIYEFRLKNRSRINECQLSYNLYYVPGILYRPMRMLSTFQKAISDGIYTAKLAMKFLVQSAWITKKKKLAHVAFEIATNSSMISYINEKKKYWAYQVRHRRERTIPFIDFFNYKKGNVELNMKPIPLYEKLGATKYIDSIKKHCELLQLNLQ